MQRFDEDFLRFEVGGIRLTDSGIAIHSDILAVLGHDGNFKICASRKEGAAGGS